jgi:YidC/Oxa1 family membrane protein insertase
MFGFLARLLAWCYDVVPNYAFAITLLTIIVMVAITPLSIKGMRSMAEMTRLQPEIKKLQEQYKNDRIKQNQEMQALFSEHKVNPLGGCLPNLLPFPVFIVLYRLLERLTSKHHHHIFDPRRILNGLPNPHYLSPSSSLYHHLIADGGRMVSFGMDLGKSAKDPHGSVGAAIPFYALIVIMTVVQYLQQRQMMARNPQTGDANAQTMQTTMKLFPAVYAFISLAIPASVVLYFLISGLLRWLQFSLSYRYDPKLNLPPLPARAGAAAAVIDTTSRTSGPNGDGGRPKEAATTRLGRLFGGPAAAPKDAPGSGKPPPAAAKPLPPSQRSAVNVRRPTGRVTAKGQRSRRRGR